MDCKQITYAIEYLQHHKKTLDLLWNDGDPDQQGLEALSSLKDRLDADLDKVCDPAFQFFDQHDIGYWGAMYQALFTTDMFGVEKNTLPILEHFLSNKAVSIFIKPGIDLSNTITKFREHYLDKLKEMEKEGIELTQLDFVRDGALGVLTTLFLNLVIDKNKILDLRGVDSAHFNNAQMLHEGVVIADSLSEKGGEWSKSIIITENGGKDLGLNKTSGVIIAKRASGSIGQMYQTIKEPVRSTILVEDTSVLDPIGCKSDLYKFKTERQEIWTPEKGRYLPLVGDSPMQAREPITTSFEFKAFKETKCGLVVIDKQSFEGIDESGLTENFEDGIIVLRALPSKDLGKGMTGGVIIIETDDSMERIQSVLSDKYIPGRGIILRRVKKQGGDTELEVVFPKK